MYTFSLRKIVESLVTRRESLPRRFLSNPKELLKCDDGSEDLPISIENPFKTEPRKCILCRLNIEPDYKNTRLLSQFQSRYTGRIYGRHITGLCKKKQESVEKEIMKAQSCGFMAILTKDLRYVNDPKLFDPDKPIRPHKY